MLANAQPIPEISGVTAEIFQNDIYPQAQPVVMRGFVDNWEAVQAGKTSSEAAASYLKNFDNGGLVEVLKGQSGFDGRFYYDESLAGHNFSLEKRSFSEALDQMVSNPDDLLYIQSSPLEQIAPGFLNNNKVSFLASYIQPRIWVSNAITVQTHFDLSQNIACAIAGRRTFTLFPPEQLPNLYMGPLHNTLAGVPVSLVDLRDPDYHRYPKFREAEQHALAATLEPGDAIYIPYFWWHHVQSLDSFNVLVNYWWNEHAYLGSPLDVFQHAVLTLRDLPPAMKKPWQVMFEQAVFADDLSAFDHIPDRLRGGLGPLDQQTRATFWQHLANTITNTARRFMGDQSGRKS